MGETLSLERGHWNPNPGGLQSGILSITVLSEREKRAWVKAYTTFWLLIVSKGI